jgi:TolB-like protein
MEIIRLSHFIMTKVGNAYFDDSAQLLRNSAGLTIPLRAQSIRVLNSLLKSQGALLTKDDVIKAVWGKTVVSDDSLVQCVKEIRLAIGDSEHEILQTVHRRGYRLVPAVLNGTSELVKVSELDGTPFSKASLAILAFTSVDGDERSERLALSFAGDLVSELARHNEFRLLSRHSAFALRGQNLSTKEICERLNVKYFVGGQVQFSEQGLRWSIELVNGADDQVIWSEHKNVDFEHMQLATNDLTWHIACSIHSSVRRSTRTRVLSRAPESLDAYETSAKVLATMLKSSIQSTKDCQQLAADAVIKYPFYAPAWMALANTHFWDLVMAHTGEWSENKATELLEEIQKAIQLDPYHAYAFAILSAVLPFNGQYTEALIAADTAVRLGASDPDMLQFKSGTLFFCGKLEEALVSSKTMLSLSPVRPGPYLTSHGRILHFLGDETEGMKFLLEAVAHSSGNNQARMTLIVALHEAGEYTQAAQHYRQLLGNTTNLNTSYFGKRWACIPEIRDRYLSAMVAYGLVS